MLKNKKILKIVTITIPCSIALLPNAILTSCSTISQYFIPVWSKSPFNNNVVINDPFLQYARNKNNIAINETNIVKFMPNSYIYKSAFDNKFNPTISRMVGYTGFNNYQWDSNGDANHPWVINESDLINKKWLDYNDKKLTYSDNTASIGNLSSYENLFNSIAINAVNSVSSNLITTLNYMLNNQNKIIGLKNNDEINKRLSIMYTNNENGFIHSSNEDNLDLYRYSYSAANLISDGKSAYKFGPYSIDWDILNCGINTNNELIDCSFIPLNTVYDLREKSFSIGNEYNKNKSYIIPTNESFVGKYTYNENNKKFDWSASENMSPYCVYTFNNDERTDVISIANVPTLIHLNNVTNAFYNPLKNTSSLFFSDWLSKPDEIDKINKAIKKTNHWSTFKDKTNSEPKIEHLSYQQVTGDDSSRNNTQPNYDDWCDTEDTETKNKFDPTILQWINNNQIHFGDFIALANYSLLNIEFSFKNDGNQILYFKTKIPYFSGFSAVFPAYFAFFADSYKQTNVYKKGKEDITTAFSRYVFDFSESSKLYKRFSNLILDLAKYDAFPAKEKQMYATTYDAFKNDKYFIYKWMYLNDPTFFNNGSNLTINSHDILKPIQ